MVLSFLNRVTRALRGFARRCADPYRPELHYMRGPGPKCRARQRGGLG
jgi:hypothetical protein